MTASTANLTTALAAVQADLPKIHKGKTATVRTDKGSYSYSYADLGDIAPAIHPLLSKHGLAFVTMPTVTEDGRFVLAYELRHTSGELINGSYPLPDPTRTTPQQVGSALTYARRYTLCCVTGVVPDEDDDGTVANTTTAADKPAEQLRTTPPDDPWQGPPVTDPKWATSLRERVVACDSLPILKGLYAELTSEVKAGHVADTDAADLKALLEERAEELKAVTAVAS
jgi:hypothetical protein